MGGGATAPGGDGPLGHPPAGHAAGGRLPDSAAPALRHGPPARPGGSCSMNNAVGPARPFTNNAGQPVLGLAGGFAATPGRVKVPHHRERPDRSMVNTGEYAGVSSYSTRCEEGLSLGGQARLTVWGQTPRRRARRDLTRSWRASETRRCHPINKCSARRRSGRLSLLRKLVERTFMLRCPRYDEGAPLVRGRVTSCAGFFEHSELRSAEGLGH